MKSSHKIGLISLAVLALASTACGTASVPRVAATATVAADLPSEPPGTQVLVITEPGHSRPGPHAVTPTVSMAMVMKTNVYTASRREASNPQPIAFHFTVDER